MKTFISMLMFVSFIYGTSAKADDIKPFETTENIGLNKKERIDTLDKYMTDVTRSITSMEGKLTDNTKKLQSLEQVIKAMKEAEQKDVEPRLGEQRSSASRNLKEVTETEKLKADILTLKNQDIEKLKVEIQELKNTVQALQDTVKYKLK